MGVYAGGLVDTNEEPDTVYEIKRRNVLAAVGGLTFGSHRLSRVGTLTAQPDETVTILYELLELLRDGQPWESQEDHSRSKRSSFITLLQAAKK